MFEKIWFEVVSEMYFVSFQTTSCLWWIFPIKPSWFSKSCSSCLLVFVLDLNILYISALPKSILWFCAWPQRHNLSEGSLRLCGRTDLEKNQSLHCIVLHCTALHYTALLYTALHCTVMFCPVLHYTILHFIALHWQVYIYCTAQFQVIIGSHYNSLQQTTLN